MAYWLMKSEPGDYSWDDLVAEPDGASTCEEHIGVVRHLQELRGAASRRVGESLFR